MKKIVISLWHWSAGTLFPYFFAFANVSKMTDLCRSFMYYRENVSCMHMLLCVCVCVGFCFKDFSLLM